MGQKLVVGPLSKGLRNDVTAFNIDNESFPTLINAYQWRLRCKRKRGTSPFTRLQRQLIGPNSGAHPLYEPLGNTSVGGSASDALFTIFSLPTTSSIVPFSIQIIIGAQIFTDDGNGNLSNGSGGTGSINYATGLLTFQTNPVLNTQPIFILFSYFPGLVVLGLEPFVGDPSLFPLEIGFDQTYAYNISLALTNDLPLDSPYPSWSVSFYRNDGPNQKINWTPVNWNLEDYQQIWTTNYAGAMWTIPGVQTSGDGVITKIGMQFQTPSAVTAVGANTITFTMPNSTLVEGDFVFANEFTGTKGDELNFQTGYVTDDTLAPTYVIKFPEQTFSGAAGDYVPGILQFLTNSSNTSKDCIRWFNGNPVNGATPPTFSTGKGWVNFMPPLTTNNIGTFSIGDLPPAANNKPYYLVGAKTVVPFKDRLLFLGAVVQQSSGNPIYLPDTIVYSQNGSPYYTASFPFTHGSTFPSPSITYTELLVPENQSSQASAWIENVTGYGGFVSAGYSRPITTVSINEDALIVGLTDRQTRLLFTGNDVVPFNFYVINSELGSDATFSSVTLDRGVITLGGRGIILTSQISSQRIDLEIPDEVFRIDVVNEGAQRTCSARDFINEWIYITYSNNQNSLSKFPDTTLQYNYRDGTWAMFKETYTTYGTVRPLSGQSWETLSYSSWLTWNDPWTAGQLTEGQPQVIAGNAQGFVVFRAQGTDESPSAYIQSVSGSTITSPDHGFNNGDFIEIEGCLGAAGQTLNGKIFQIEKVTQNTFGIVPRLTIGTYLGRGLIYRYYIPYIQSKEFPTAWEMGRKTRIGAQQYLFTYTDDAQITLLIFLSQAGGNPYNTGPIVPSPNVANSSLVYSTVLYTCPESSNLGLSAPNTNLQMVTANDQEQIWHRMNTSLLGDTVQFGFTMSTEQMGQDGYLQTRDNSGNIVFYSITGAIQGNPCVLTCNGQFTQGSLVKIENVVGMTQLNYVSSQYNYYEVISSDGVYVTINIDSTAFTAYVSGGRISQVYNPNPTAEIEFHSAVIDINPSQLLA